MGSEFIILCGGWGDLSIDDFGLDGANALDEVVFVGFEGRL